MRNNQFIVGFTQRLVDQDVQRLRDDYETHLLDCHFMSLLDYSMATNGVSEEGVIGCINEAWRQGITLPGDAVGKLPKKEGQRHRGRQAG